MIKKLFKYGIVFIWLILIFLSLFLNAITEKEREEKNALIGARAFFQQLLITRAWNAQHEIYAKMNQLNKPNKYLDIKNRDFISIEGIQLTKINPAYMTRQMSKIAFKKNGVKFNIVSLNPKNPRNKAVKWEKKNLFLFQNGAKEFSEFIKIENYRKFRYMAPLYVEKSCLSCHSTEKIGEIRGGISITVPYLEYKINYVILVMHIVIGLFGLLALFSFFIYQNRIDLKLLKKKEIAEKSNLEKSQFLANVSHEIRTPINSILGMIDLVLLTDSTEESLDYLIMAKESSFYLSNLVNDLLDLAKLEAGKLQLDNKNFNLNETIEKVISMFVFKAKEKKIDLKFEISNQLPNLLYGDNQALVQVLINLLSNAIKVTNQGFVILRVNLKANFLGGYKIEFIVEDSGQGMTSKQIEVIFKEYVQLKYENKQDDKGTGIGLAISKKLVNLMGGEILVESVIEKGTKFIFSLDFKQAIEMEKKQDEVENNIQFVNNLNILVVEDNTLNIKLLKVVLNKLKHKVNVAFDGVEALDILSKNYFDLILMDIEMVGMGGFETAKEIREGKIKGVENIPIILMSAHLYSEIKDKYLDLEIDFIH